MVSLILLQTVNRPRRRVLGRVPVLTLTLVLVAALGLGWASAGSPVVTLLVDGAPITCDVAPRLVEGRVLVPLRAVAEALALEVTWDAEAMTVFVGPRGATPFLPTGSIRLVVCGCEVRPDIPPGLINGRVFVPIRVVLETLGCEVDWDQAKQTVLVTSTRLEVDGPPVGATLTPERNQRTYTVTATPGTVCTAVATTASPDFPLTVGVFTLVPGTGPQTERGQVRSDGRVDWLATAPGEYRLTVFTGPGKAGAYSLRVTGKPCAPVSIGSVVLGTLTQPAPATGCDGEPLHGFALPVKTGVWYQVAAGGPQGVCLSWYGEGQGPQGTASNVRTDVHARATKDGTWFVRVAAWDQLPCEYILVVSEVISVPIVPDGPAVTGRFNDRLEPHWYSFTAEAGKLYTFRATDPMGPMLIVTVEDSSVSMMLPGPKGIVSLAPGPVVFQVVHWGGVSSQYTLSIVSSPD